MTDVGSTTAAMLQRAARIGREAGLKYVYAGNLPGRVGDLEHTCCSQCGEIVIARRGYLIQKYALSPEGGCPACGVPVPGRWSRAFGGQRTSMPFLPHDRRRLSVI
jgi:pyruvate formate lyase activating enzyme